jgi:hypothetical protein
VSTSFLCIYVLCLSFFSPVSLIAYISSVHRPFSYFLPVTAHAPFVLVFLASPNDVSHIFVSSLALLSNYHRQMQLHHTFCVISFWPPTLRHFLTFANDPPLYIPEFYGDIHSSSPVYTETSRSPIPTRAGDCDRGTGEGWPEEMGLAKPTHLQWDLSSPSPCRLILASRRCFRAKFQTYVLDSKTCIIIPTCSLFFFFLVRLVISTYVAVKKSNYTASPTLTYRN